MATWNKVLFERTGEAYQEIDDRGHVVRYVDAQGALLFEQPPVGEACAVVEAVASPSVGMRALAKSREDAEAVATAAAKQERETVLRAALSEALDAWARFENNPRIDELRGVLSR